MSSVIIKILKLLALYNIIRYLTKETFLYCEIDVLSELKPSVYMYQVFNMKFRYYMGISISEILELF